MRPSAGGSSQRAVWAASRTPAGPAWPCSRSATRYRKGSLLFRIALGSPTDEDLRTGIEGAEYKVAVEIDDVGTDAQDGWFVFIQGAAHRLDSGHDRVSAGPPGGQPPAGSARENFVRVTPTFIAGRRLRRH
jgi:hypothetical protein